MTNVKYAVIIINYNTFDDAIAAAESVIEKSTSSEFVICIGDNGSTKNKEGEKLMAFHHEKVKVLDLRKNLGYAVGNNTAIRELEKECCADYYVIMNPDVLLLEKGTIEDMINRIETVGGNVVGGQPLVWNCYYPGLPEEQQNIRRVPNYIDLCILSFLPFKALFSRRYKYLTYKDDAPYHNELRYLVPSGAFFIIQAEEFKKIGMFDEHTFLYFEEQILGKKLEKDKKELLFMPQFKVRHEHGKSTGSNHYKYSKFADKCARDSYNYYAQAYLSVGKSKLRFLKLLHSANSVFLKTRAAWNERIDKR